jgi:hypothetical protein
MLEGELLGALTLGRRTAVVAFAADTGKEVWKAGKDAASYAAGGHHDRRHSTPDLLHTPGLLSLDPKDGRSGSAAAGVAH